MGLRGCEAEGYTMMQVVLPPQNILAVQPGAGQHFGSRAVQKLMTNLLANALAQMEHPKEAPGRRWLGAGGCNQPASLHTCLVPVSPPQTPTTAP